MAPAPCWSHGCPPAPIPEFLTSAFNRFAKAVDTLPQEPGGMGQMEDAISQEIRELPGYAFKRIDQIARKVGRRRTTRGASAAAS